MTKTIINQSKLCIPKFWQAYLALILFLSIYLISSSDNALYIINLLFSVLIPVGIIAANKHNKHELFPWRFLLIGIIVIEIAVILQSLRHFGMEINPNIPYWIEQIGIVLVTIFAFSNMLLFEKRFNLKGFTIDYTLLCVTILCLILLVFPNLLNHFLYEITLEQKLLFVKLLTGLLLISMAIIHHYLSRVIRLADIVRMITVIFLSLHFLVDTLMNFGIYSLSSQLSWSFYQLAATFIILFAFIEKLDLDYVQHVSSQLGNRLTWIANTMAILVIPAGIIFRWYQGYTAINPIVTSLASFILSTIVLWRISLIIKNSNKQKTKLKNIAHTDELTGALNYFGSYEKQSKMALNNSLIITLNIDDFKSINDLYGRHFGDEVLKKLASRLQKVPNVLLVSRISSDNFMVVFKVYKERIHDQFISLQKELGVWDIVLGRRIAVPLTFGASHSSNNIDPEILARRAERALEFARSKHLEFYLFNDDDDNNLLPRHELRGILQQALDHNYLPVHFQPIYDLEKGSLTAMELLIRVQSNEHGLLLPRQFLEQAQSYGLLASLTKVCIHMIAQSFKELPSVTINLNLSPYMLDNPKILNELLACFKEEKLPPSRFCIEITEDENIPAEHLLSSVNLLKKLGFSIAMDDFGTGYSSLSRLSTLPFDTVKIDRSLLLAASSGNKAILESTINLIKRLGLSAVVEGVETLEQLTLIKVLGADSVQGFLLSKPVNIKEAVNLPLNAANFITEF